MRILPQKTIALCIDMQEKLIPVMHDADHLIKRASILLEGLNILGVETKFLRQYPKGLGDTIPKIRALAGEAHQPYDKLAYSALGDEAIKEMLETKQAENGIQNILVFGIEAHICVLQSCIDLKAAGFTPVLICDAVSSRNPWERELATRRAEQEEVLLSSVESILFELCRVAGMDEFKQISRLVR